MANHRPRNQKCCPTDTSYHSANKPKINYQQKRSTTLEKKLREVRATFDRPRSVDQASEGVGRQGTTFENGESRILPTHLYEKKARQRYSSPTLPPSPLQRTAGLVSRETETEPNHSRVHTRVPWLSEIYIAHNHNGSLVRLVLIFVLVFFAVHT